MADESLTDRVILLKLACLIPFTGIKGRRELPELSSEKMGPVINIFCWGGILRHSGVLSVSLHDSGDDIGPIPDVAGFLGWISLAGVEENGSGVACGEVAAIT